MSTDARGLQEEQCTFAVGVAGLVAAAAALAVAVVAAAALALLAALRLRIVPVPPPPPPSCLVCSSTVISYITVDS